MPRTTKKTARKAATKPSKSTTRSTKRESVDRFVKDLYDKHGKVMTRLAYE